MELFKIIKNINEFRGGAKGPCPYSKMTKVALLFALHMQCIINLGSKNTAIYTQYVHFQQVFMS